VVTSPLSCPILVYQELKLDQQLAPAREAVSSAIAAGSTNVLRAVEGIRGRWAAGRQSIGSSSALNVNANANASTSSLNTPAVEITQSEADLAASTAAPPKNGIAPSQAPADTAAGAAISSWGTGIGSFFSSRWSRGASPQPAPPAPKPLPADPPLAAAPEPPTPRVVDFHPRNLDEEQHDRDRERFKDDNASVIGFAV
jgi:hypothetical protein